MSESEKLTIIIIGNVMPQLKWNDTYHIVINLYIENNWD